MKEVTYILTKDLTNISRELIYRLEYIIKEYHTPDKMIMIQPNISVSYSNLIKGLNKIVEKEGYNDYDQRLLNSIREHFYNELKTSYLKRKSRYT